MIDWWVISSILAGLGTAYGANAYNKKDATELRQKAVELLAQGEGKGWAAKIEELQSKVANQILRANRDFRQIYDKVGSSSPEFSI